MIVFESRLVRRFVGRLERGEELLGTLRQHCEAERVRGAWVRAAGILEWAELASWDPEREVWRAPRRIEGPLTATIEGSVAIRGGPISIELRAALGRDQGEPAIVGSLVEARAYALEIAIESYDDVRLERDEDPHTGMALLKGPRVPGITAREPRREPFPAPGPRPISSARPGSAIDPARAGSAIDPARAGSAIEARAGSAIDPARRGPHLAPAPGSPVSWAELAALSQKAERAARREDPEFLAEPQPQKGEWIEHRQFGLCRVEGEDEDGGLRIRLPSGVRKVIKLDVLEVLPPRREADRTIYPIRPRKR